MGRPATIQRQQLLDTARRVFARKGFEAATLADIASELKVTPAAVLRHAGSKQRLFADAMRDGQIELPQCIRDLDHARGDEDPRIVLGNFARELIPFLGGVLSVVVAVHMHERATEAEIRIPFDSKAEDAPPRQGLRVVERYFARAASAGTVRITDYRAAARLFLGSLHSYVLYHQVIKLPSYPLQPYVDALIDLWTNGGFGASKAKNSARGDSDRAPRAGRGGNVRVRSAQSDPARARSGRDARGEDGERRVADGRPRHTRSRR